MSRLYLLLAVVAVGCGDIVLSTRELPQLTQGNFLAEVVPPVDYYRQGLISRFRNIERQEDTSRQFFINFRGGDVAQGVESGQSFLPCQQRATVPASNFDHDAQMIVIGAIADFFGKYKLSKDLQVVIDRPQLDSYSTVHVGGSYHEVLGCHDEENVLGHAPTDDGDINPIDIGFVFDKHGDGDLLLRAIVHVIGRMSGLATTNRSDEVMSLTMSAVTPLRFSPQTLAIKKVEQSSPTGSHLAGHDFLVALADKLSDHDEDEDNTLSPIFAERLRSNVPDSVETPGLERVVAVLLPKDKKSNKISFKGILGQIVRKTVAKKFGNTPASVLDAILSRDGKSKASPQEFLDFSQLLELEQINRFAELFPMLDQQLNLINKIATADDRQSLQSVLKVGYFQRLAKISR